jgi:hypothetical protein
MNIRQSWRSAQFSDEEKVNDLKRKTLWERRGFRAALAQIAHNATQTTTNPVASISVAT